MVALTAVTLLMSLGAEPVAKPGPSLQVPALQLALLGGESRSAPSGGDWPVEPAKTPAPVRVESTARRSLVGPIVMTSIGAAILGGAALGLELVLSATSASS